MTTERRVLVLGPSEPTDLGRIEDLAIRIQVETGTLLDRGPSETRPSGIVRHAWRERRPYALTTPMWMILTFNPEIPACWLEVRSDDAAAADRIVTLARETLRAPEWQELEAAATAAEREPGAITRLALGASSATSAAVLQAVLAGLRSSSPNVRMDAALAVVTAELGVARSAMERAAEVEADPEVLSTLRWAAGALPQS